MAQTAPGGIPLTDDGTAVKVADFAITAGQDATLDRVKTLALALVSANVTADTLVKTGAGAILGYVVHAATAGGIIEIRDSVTAGGGTTRVTIPASSAVGVYSFGGLGIPCATGVYLDFTGTGTVSVLYI